MNPPQGRLSHTKRPFFKVAYDMRHVVYSVVRNRPATINNQQGFQSAARGSGFFVSPEIFVTCNHVLNDPADPHLAGDNYFLIANMGIGVPPRIVAVANPSIGNDIHLFPQFDFAVLRVPAETNRPYASLSFNRVYEGEEIGVAGYPVARLFAVNGVLSADGLIYRVGRGPVGASYITNISQILQQIPLVEVNFLFVPGNSGGPVFLAETGEVIGFVQGFHDTKIREKVVTAHPNTQLPPGVGNQYVENLNAIYSMAFKLDIVRATLQGFGVGL
jgi:serine protease Do